MKQALSTQKLGFLRSAYAAHFLLAAAAVLLRLWRLGEPALRADTIDIWKICRSGIGAFEISRRWMELMGISGQFPLPVVMIRIFLSLLRLPVTEFNMRLLDTFWAGLTVFACCQAGRRLFSARAGLLWGALLAVHPYFIQATREPYYYAPMLAGLSLMLWGVTSAFDTASAQSAASGWVKRWFLILAIGFVLAIYSQPSSWGLAAVMLVAVYIRLMIARQWHELAVLSAVLLLLGLPMLFMPWGLRHILTLTSAEHQAQNLRIAAGESHKAIPEYLAEVWMHFSWGRGLWRCALGLAAVALFVEDARRNFRKPRRLLLAALLAGGVIFSLTGRGRAVPFQATRYMISVFPLLLGCYAQGLDGFLARAENWGVLRRFKPLLGWGVALLFLAPFVRPAVWALGLRGSPTPYKDIVRWLDTQLPRGTPVLVDRWFEPWNEFKVYPSTNVFLTFTVPSEPMDTFLRLNWRGTAMEFFEKFPDAAYMELAKTYWEKPEVGPWLWPRQYFKNKVEIRNDAALKLRAAGLLYRDDGGAFTNRVVVEIFYNTREDYLAACREKGLSLALWCGAGWEYYKPALYNPGLAYANPPDCRDWRVLGDSAELEAYNLGPEPQENVFLAIRAVAANGDKTVRLDRHVLEFPQGRILDCRVGPLTLPPGRATLQMRDAKRDAQSSILLVERISIEKSD